MRVVPLYVRFGETSFRDYVELDPHELLRAAAHAPTRCRRRPSRRRCDFAPSTRRCRLRADLLAPHLRRSSRGRSRARRSPPQRPAATGSGSSTPSRRRSGSRCSRSTSSGCSSAGPTTRRSTRCRAAPRNAVILFTVDTLEYLAKGGRIGRAQAFAGSLLKVKPILTIEDGEVVPLTRVRGRQKALDEFRRRFEEATTDGPGLRVGHRARGGRGDGRAAADARAGDAPAGRDRARHDPRRGRGHARRPGHRRLLLPTDVWLVVRLAVVVVERLDAADHAEPAPADLVRARNTSRCRWAPGAVDEHGQRRSGPARKEWLTRDPGGRAIR